ncbi:hypothetical protein VNO78_23015 [Psophocarpus tetragonolobus]|uniref:BHLH domain-containing protein n=1 Tax=Psophocarpus tetragonolobus TaxID=3891 RepID=A0AAN9S391_PSOTE
MDPVFVLPQPMRAHFLSSLLQSFGATYVCLWQYDSTLSNRLFYLDGFFDVTKPLAESLFHQFRALTKQGLSSNQCSYLSLSIPGTSHLPENLPTQTSPQEQSIQALDQVIIPSYFSTPKGEHEAIVRAFIHVISSPSSSTSQQHQVPHQNFPNYTSLIHPGDTAFKGYRSDIMNSNITPYMGSNCGRQSLQNRSFAFFRNLNPVRIRERNIIQAASPHSTYTQKCHAISERRRRDKLNESFQALRALLPPGTKRGKDISSDERLNVGVWHASESKSSSSEEQMVELQVTVKGENCQVHVLIRLLEFLEGIQNVNLISIAANSHITPGTPINQFTFALKIIQGSEWDEGVFQEAVNRVAADVMQWHRGSITLNYINISKNLM